MATAELEARVRDEGETAVIELSGDIDRDADGHGHACDRNGNNHADGNRHAAIAPASAASATRITLLRSAPVGALRPTSATTAAVKRAI